MKWSVHLFLFGIAFCVTIQGYSQTNSATVLANVKGAIWDSVQETSLSATTVAFYKMDTVLLAYTISDKQGNFLVKNLPVGVQLKVVATFIGYTTAEKKVVIPPSVKEVDLGRISMKPESGTLETVIVTAIPPVRVKGDTLEFNADAFKLDENAQAEDLLRILPGVMIWSDGTITVNGREVNSVLVNGKPFFGNDVRMATQNLPKNIIDKVQVYQKGSAESGPVRDSLTEINLKLKKGKEFGYFGKLGAGFGSNKTTELDGSLNFFNSKTQLSVAGVHNNSNKMVHDTRTLLQNHTFKGPGLDMSYQSDFSRQGLNTITAGGFLLQHNFAGIPDQDKQHSLNAQGFFNSGSNFLLTDTRAITAVTDSQYYQREGRSQGTNRFTSSNADFSQRYGTSNNSFDLFGTYSRQRQQGEANTCDSIKDQSGQLLSTNNFISNSASENSSVSVNTRFEHGERNRREEKETLKPFSNYSVDYRFNSRNFDNRRESQTSYVAITDAGKSRLFNRQYNNQFSMQSHHLMASLPMLISGRVTMGFQPSMHLLRQKRDNLVSDKKAAGEFQNNPYLTNRQEESNLTIYPAFTTSKNFNHSSGNGSISAKGGPQFFINKSSSQKQFQQFSRKYLNWVGEVHVNYWAMRSYVYRKTIQLMFNSMIEYPTVEQLAPLIDSIDLNYIQSGNLFLKEQQTRSLSIHFDHTSLKSKKNLGYELALSANQISNYFARNTYIDTLGRTISNTVNANGYLRAGLDLRVKKNMKLEKSQLELMLSPGLGISRVPQYINGIKIFFANLAPSFRPSLTYSYSDRLSIQVANNTFYNQYRESGTGISNSNVTNELSGKLYLNITKKLSVSTNLMHTSAKFNKDQPITFTIWNGYLKYRMFKGNNAELQFSALDILKQNKILNTYGATNTLTQVRTNALQQYFMLTLSYYPRKFGKK